MIKEKYIYVEFEDTNQAYMSRFQNFIDTD